MPDMRTLGQMQVRAVYLMSARNFSIGVWTGEYFIGVRYKMGHSYLSCEYHWESDPSFGTVKPYRILCLVPESIDLVCDAEVPWTEVTGGKADKHYLRVYQPLYDFLGRITEEHRDDLNAILS